MYLLDSRPPDFETHHRQALCAGRHPSAAGKMVGARNALGMLWFAILLSVQCARKLALAVVNEFDFMAVGGCGVNDERVPKCDD